MRRRVRRLVQTLHGDAGLGLQPTEAPLNVGAYRRTAQRRMMLSHLRETASQLPDLAQVDWAHLDNQAAAK